MNILFLVPRIDKASTRYRVIQYQDSLHGRGVDTEVLAIGKSWQERLRIYKKLNQFDVVFIQKKLFQPWEIAAIRRRSRFLVYDLDDAVMFKERETTDSDPVPEWKFPGTAKRADLILAGNSYLQSLVLPLNPHAEVLPTCVDLNRYTLKESPENEEVVIGWIGSRKTLHYLLSLRDTLDQLVRRHPHIRLKIVADDFFDCPSFPVQKKIWKEDEEIQDLQSFDIGIMPLSDNYWTRGKCGFKLIQCMAVGVPVVCSPVGMNCEIVQNGENGFWASNREEWLLNLGKLIESRSLRMQLGIKGREQIEKKYSLQINAPRLLQHINKYLSRP